MASDLFGGVVFETRMPVENNGESALGVAVLANGAGEPLPGRVLRAFVHYRRTNDAKTTCADEVIARIST